MEKVLLITGCIKPTYNALYLTIRDEKSRLEQYKKTVEWALKESGFDIIIFCENSNYDYDFENYNTKNKKFEYLTFNGDTTKSDKFGKGYGEGEIIKYALDNSKYLKKSDYFYKLTGRLTIKNINKILKNEKNENYFLNFLYSRKSIDTRFYKINTKIYIEYLYKEYEKVRDAENMPLEKLFYTKIKESNIKYRCFRYFPIISGISGSTGIEYKMNKFKIFVYNCLCKFNLYNTQIISYLFSKIVGK